MLFQLPSLLAKAVDQLLVVSLHRVDIHCVQAGESLFHIVQLCLVFSFSLIDLLLEQFNLMVKLIPIPRMMLQVPLEFILQLLYFSILDIDQLSQPIKLCLELLILRAHVFSQMADLVVEPLLEFIVYYLYLSVFLLYHV